MWKITPYNQGVWLMAILLGFSVTLKAHDHPKDAAREAAWRKQEIAIARQEGLDTLPEYRAAVDSCRRSWLRTAVADSARLEEATRRSYQYLAQRGEGLRCLVSEIFRPLPQNATARAQQRAEAEMDSLYQALQQGADFSQLASSHSDHPGVHEVASLQRPVEWEEAVFSTPEGSYTHPFHTPQGLHIVQVWRRTPLPPYEEMRPQLQEALGPHSWQQITQAAAGRMKKAFGYRPHQAGIDELLRQGQTKQTLFTLHGRAYTGDDFARFAQAHPYRLRRQWNDFLLRSLLACEEQMLAESHPEVEQRLALWSDSLLWQLAARRHWGDEALSDTIRLKAYFESHRSDFHWKEVRYRGIVLQCASKRVAKQARKLLKALPPSEWMEAIRLMFNKGQEPQIEAKQGVFAAGDHPWIDHFVFKQEKPQPHPDFPIATCVGHKQKGPEQWSEVGEELRQAYRNHLRTAWRERHGASVKVEINQEELKTVNSQGSN